MLTQKFINGKINVVNLQKEKAMKKSKFSNVSGKHFAEGKHTPNSL